MKRNINLKTVWDVFTDKYSLLLIHPQYFVKKYNDTAVKMAEKYAKGDLLDVGCGRMPYRDRIINRVKKYVGLDYSTTAKLYHGKYKPDIYGDAQKLPVASNSFDTVLSLQVVEHLPDPKASIKETYRVLRKNGVFILSTVQSYPIHDEPHDYYRYTQYGLRFLLNDCGFKILEHKGEGNFFIQESQNLNVYLMLQIKKLIRSKKTILIAIILLFPIMTIAIISNILAFLSMPFDKKSNFSIMQTFVVQK